MGMGKTKTLLLTGLALLALAAPMAATAAAPTRDEYKAAVEPICKTNTKANERILGGVKAKVKKGKLGAAGGQFQKAARALKKAIRQAQGRAPARGRQARLGKWLTYVNQEAEQFAAVAKKLKGDNKAGAQRLVVRLTRTATQANNQVLPFEFEYCRLDPSKFT